jgi:hypothetical protein
MNSLSVSLFLVFMLRGGWRFLSLLTGVIGFLAEHLLVLFI